MGFVNELMEDGRYQTIDRSRNIVLKRMDRFSADCTTKFKLSVDGIEYTVEVDQGTEKTLSNKTNVYWHVYQIYGSDANSAKLKEIITEAFQNYGYAGSTKNIDIVKVTFSDNLNP